MTVSYPDTEAEIMQLRSQVATLEQLIEVHEHVTADQNRRLEQTLQAMQEQSRILQSVLHSISDGVVVANKQGQIILCNPAAERFCGQTLTGSPSISEVQWQGCYRPDMTTYLPDELPLSLALQGIVTEPVEMLVRQAGEAQELWLSVTAQPLVDAQGAQHGGVMVLHDITLHKRAEAERRAHQEQIIAAQAATLREISTPLIPVANDVLVMPLVGALDSTRTQQVISVLLHGVSAKHVRIVILDVTGVSVIDTQVASALTSAAQAVRLLGATVILTGIKPEVAQTLVGLGVDLSAIKTLATLQAGITSALWGRRP